MDQSEDLFSRKMGQDERNKILPPLAPVSPHVHSSICEDQAVAQNMLF